MLPTLHTSFDALLLTRPGQWGDGPVVSAYLDMADRQDFLKRLGGKHVPSADQRALERVLADRRFIDARGLALFSDVEHGRFDAHPLDFPVEAQLVVDSEPYLLPIWEGCWRHPRLAVVALTTHQATISRAERGAIRELQTLRGEEPVEIQRDKPRQTFKKRFAHTHHERLHDPAEDQYLHVVAAELSAAWEPGRDAGLILIGPSTLTAALKRLLPRRIDRPILVETTHAGRSPKADEIHEVVNRLWQGWLDGNDARISQELESRCQQSYRVVEGPEATLNALRLGQVSEIVVGRQRTAWFERGAFWDGSGPRPFHALQEILRLASRGRTPVQMLLPGEQPDPLMPHSGVAGLLRETGAGQIGISA